jgi:quercetin dioxygenase-like cupin family protein
MQQGHVTQPHRHDVDGELISAVYYIRVPSDSGDLILTGDSRQKTILPREGMFVFFQPDVLHEVTENKSGATRLSIGMNFGIRK